MLLPVGNRVSQAAKIFAKSCLLIAMSQNSKMQVCLWYGVKQIKSYLRKQRVLREKVSYNFVLPQVVIIFAIKPISSSICERLKGGEASSWNYVQKMKNNLKHIFTKFRQFTS